MKTTQQQNEPTPYAKSLHADRAAAQEAEQNYTQTPWAVKVSPSGCALVVDKMGNQIAALSNMEVDQLDAQQIVKAVNEHAALLAVAQAADLVEAARRPHGSNSTYPDGCECEQCEAWDSLKQAIKALDRALDTKRQIKAALLVTVAVAEAIKDSPEGVRSGVLYAHVCGHLSLPAYESVINTLVNAKLVERGPAHLLTWVGPKAEGEVVK